MNDKNILDVIKAVQKSADLVRGYNGQKIDLSKMSIFTREPHLHQSSDEMSEDQSAEFERKNPELFNFLRSMDDALGKLF